MTAPAWEPLAPRIALLGDVGDPFPGVEVHRALDVEQAIAIAPVLLVVDGETAADDRRQLRRLTAAGTTIVVLDPVNKRSAGDLPVLSEPDGTGLWLRPAIDPSVVNPVGWRRGARRPLGINPTAGGDHLTAFLAGASSETAVFVPPTPSDVGSSVRAAGARTVRYEDTDDLVDRLRRIRVLVDDPRWHRSAATSWRTVITSLAAGTPVVTTADAVAVAEGLPVELATPDELAHRAEGLGADDDERERCSVAARRQVLAEHSGRARLSVLLESLGEQPLAEPTISVLLATNRPELLPHAVASVASQQSVQVELVLLLHGDGFDGASIPDTVLPTKVLRLDGDKVLGEVLNAGLDAASGELIAKMDDDDLYGHAHLQDLLLALRYSGADLVGKRIDHVYLADRDVTIVRRRSNPERDRDHVSGPTLLLSAELARTYRFSPVPRRVDSTLHERLLADGRRIYGTHGLDVVLHRHGGHTWDADHERMLAEAEHVADGLDLTRAASTPDAFSPPSW